MSYDPPPTYASPTSGYVSVVPPPIAPGVACTDGTSYIAPNTPLLAVPVPAPAIYVQESHDAKYRDISMTVRCQFCGNIGPTKIRHINGLLTWMSGGIVCLFGGWCGCCFIPFCLDVCKDVEHYCGSCGRVVGKFEKIKF
ncbi:lipopolysaccharide-induced tumor necrosis factor-alpha factor [Pelomyxa schiedti]|nr:lipopolysaccharide-induced tumor necrosis factor-alpha factor [Pelomyxa schiedti]